ncbi:MAG: hypothetical protein AAF411_12590 [Myxococcota bacterium]
MSTAYGQAPSPDAAEPTEVSEAQTLFGAGNLALRDERYSEAAAAFRRSLELFPYLPTAHNLSLALEASGDTLGAARLCAELLEGNFGDAEPALRASVAERLQRLDASLGRVEVNAEVPAVLQIGDASWTIEGRTLVRLVPGAHTLSFSSPGHRRRSIALRLEAGSLERVSANLEAVLEGQLVVDGPVGATIVIEGVTRGPSPLVVSLPAGVYDVHLVGGPPRAVSVDAGAEVRIELSARPHPARRRRVVVALIVTAAALAAVGAAVAIGVTARRSDSDSLFTLRY